jgi:hypothetical protein
VVAFLGERVNSWKDQDVRRVLAPFARIAEELDVTVICIVHLNKSATTDLIQRVAGSSGFANAARSVLAADRHPNDPDGEEYVLVHAKTNWGTYAPTIKYRIEARNVLGDGGEDIDTAGVVWLGEEPSITANNVLERHDERTRTELDEAADWLRGILAIGKTPASEVRFKAKRDGIGWRTVERAKRSSASDPLSHRNPRVRGCGRCRPSPKAATAGTRALPMSRLAALAVFGIYQRKQATRAAKAATSHI